MPEATWQVSGQAGTRTRSRLASKALMFALHSSVSWGCPEAVPRPLTQEDQRAFQLGDAETRVSGCGWPRVGGQWIWIKEEDAVCPPAWEQGGCFVRVLCWHLEAGVHGGRGESPPLQGPTHPQPGPRC